MKYRKKPIIVEAYQVTKYSLNSIYWDFNAPEWLLDAINDDIVQENFLKGIFIKTLEGNMEVNENDYIIKRVAGELYPCKPDIFEETYERIYE